MPRERKAHKVAEEECVPSRSMGFGMTRHGSPSRDGMSHVKEGRI